jgi:dihydrodipicolinate synthase/N-acetylneuraminate lyase
VDWLADIASAAPTLPLFYYHLPGTTYVDIKVADLLQVSGNGNGSISWKAVHLVNLLCR